jgi:hypothetical protein
MIGYKSIWYGKEVEGRFTDIETCFIADFSPLVYGRERIKPTPHIYICSPATEQLINDSKSKDFNWQNIFDMISDTQFVSIEVTPGMLEKIPPMIRIRAHILLMLDCKDAALLKQTDSIKVVYADYKLYCTTVHNMQSVNPDDYKFDRHEV